MVVNSSILNQAKYATTETYGFLFANYPTIYILLDIDLFRLKQK